MFKLSSFTLFPIFYLYLPYRRLEVPAINGHHGEEEGKEREPRHEEVFSEVMTPLMSLSIPVYSPILRQRKAISKRYHIDGDDDDQIPIFLPSRIASSSALRLHFILKVAIL